MCGWILYKTDKFHGPWWPDIIHSNSVLLSSRFDEFSRNFYIRLTVYAINIYIYYRSCFIVAMVLHWKRVRCAEHVRFHFVIPLNVAVTTGLDFEGVWRNKLHLIYNNEKTNSNEKKLFYCNVNWVRITWLSKIFLPLE